MVMNNKFGVIECGPVRLRAHRGTVVYRSWQELLSVESGEKVRAEGLSEAACKIYEYLPQHSPRAQEHTKRRPPGGGCCLREEAAELNAFLSRLQAELAILLTQLLPTNCH
jgi:hypothetical protein